jgi:hypothetical protein
MVPFYDGLQSLQVAALEATLVQLMGANGKLGASYKKVDGSSAYNERAALR